jgi:hypothetical protein
MPAKAPAPEEDISHADDEGRRASEGRRKRSHQEADLPVVDDDDDDEVCAAWSGRRALWASKWRRVKQAIDLRIVINVK